MQEENITRAIIVVQIGMTPSAKQVNTHIIYYYIKQLTQKCIWKTEIAEPLLY